MRTVRRSCRPRKSGFTRLILRATMFRCLRMNTQTIGTSTALMRATTSGATNFVNRLKNLYAKINSASARETVACDWLLLVTARDDVESPAVDGRHAGLDERLVVTDAMQLDLQLLAPRRLDSRL